MSAGSFVFVLTLNSLGIFSKLAGISASAGRPYLGSFKKS
jgi:hypothetical protein